MEQTTVTRLRSAIVDALSEGDDRAAYELLQLIVAPADQPLTGPALPALSVKPQLSLPPGDAHDYHFWARLVRETFLPFLQAYGRHQFTSHELMSWLEARELPLTTGDMECHSSGREVWRSQISSALGYLKRIGCINATPFSRAYTIQAPSLPGAQ